MSSSYERFNFYHLSSSETENQILELYNNQELTIPLDNKYSIYKTISSRYNYLFQLKHNFDEIEINAPTLEQYYQYFKVTAKDIDGTAKHSTDELQQMDPSDVLFDTAYNNFISSKLSTNNKTSRSNNVVYWYYKDAIDNDERKLTICQAKRIYCKLYEFMIIQRPIFRILIEQYKNYEGKVNIVSEYIEKNFTHFATKEQVVEFFKNPKLDFTDCYCLMEILVNFPNLNNCLWNQKENFVDGELVEPTFNLFHSTTSSFDSDSSYSSTSEFEPMKEYNEFTPSDDENNNTSTLTDSDFDIIND